MFTYWKCTHIENLFREKREKEKKCNCIILCTRIKQHVFGCSNACVSLHSVWTQFPYKRMEKPTLVLNKKKYQSQRFSSLNLFFHFLLRAFIVMFCDFFYILTRFIFIALSFLKNVLNYVHTDHCNIWILTYSPFNRAQSLCIDEKRRRSNFNTHIQYIQYNIQLFILIIL